MASINGDDISIDAFRQKVEATSRRMGPNASYMQVVNMVWDQEVRNTILEKQYKDLGIDIERDQIMDYIKTIPAYYESPEFQNQNGVFDENRFRSFLADLKANDPVQYDMWLQEEAAIIQNARQQAYFNLVRAGVGATLKEGELDYKLTNDKMDLTYVRIPYTSIPDSSITVTKSEIESYIKAHKDEYKQDPGRDIQFVYFEEKPSLEDENTVKDELLKLLDNSLEYNAQADKTDTIQGFRTTTDAAAFLERHSDTPLDTLYRAKRDLSPLFADSLAALKKGGLYGPYRDGNFYRVSKMVDIRPNGSVKSSHILIAYEGALRANPEIKRTKEEASKIAAEILAEAKKKETVFVELARDKSEDAQSAPLGGDIGYFQKGRLAKEYNDYIFANPVGSIGLVETDFGFHIIKIDDKQDVFQLAHLSREVEPSEETTNKLFTDATKFEMDAIESKGSFGELARNNEYVVMPVNKINEMDENLPGLGAQRSLVQWAFNPQTKLGEIKRFNINNGYVVVQLTGIYKDGLMSVEDASAIVLPKIRRERKAAQIISANKGKSMETVAKDNNVSTSTASAVSVKSPTLPGAGSEPEVVGTAYTLAAGQTSQLIEGQTGVYMVTVTKKEEAPKMDNYSTFASSLQAANAGKVNSGVYEALRKASKIEDKRATFY